MVAHLHRAHFRSDGFHHTGAFVADHSGQPPVTVVNGFLTVTITKQPGITYVVQSTGSLDPASWSASTTTTLTDNATTLTVRDNVPVTSGENRFLRVRVVAP